jgi:hypothetical protein
MNEVVESEEEEDNQRYYHLHSCVKVHRMTKEDHCSALFHVYLRDIWFKI